MSPYLNKGKKLKEWVIVINLMLKDAQVYIIYYNYRRLKLF